MKVSMVSEHASPLAALGSVDAGGQNVHVGHLARALGRLGAQVTVHTRRDNPNLPRRVDLAPNVVVDHIPAGPAAPLPKDELLPHMEAFARELGNTWRDDRPDVVHSHFWMSGLAALEAGRVVGVPVAHTYHALGVEKRRQQGAADTSPDSRVEVERRLAREVDHILATSAHESSELIRMGGGLDRISIVPCGVDLDRFCPAGDVAPRRPGLRRIVVVSRLVPRKGIGNVISALSQLPGVELVVAGGPAAGADDDPEATRLRELAERLGVDDRVWLLGALPHDSIPALIRSADLVACCPWYEPFGMVAVEAMACGRPVVATAVGGLAETVIDGVTGSHVPPRRPDRLAAAADRLLSNDWLSRAMGDAAISRAQRFGWDRIAAETLDVLSSLAEAGAARRRGDVPMALPTSHNHLAALRRPLAALDDEVDRLERWGAQLASVLSRGGRLLVAGNGGSAAQAQHLTSELVGRYRDERQPFSAIALCAESSSVTAITNDYGADLLFARQVQAHGRPGDVFVALSTSGRSPNLLAAAEAARERGLTVWALTGDAPNPLLERVDDALVVEAPFTATVQEVHQVAVHLICASVDRALGTSMAMAMELTS